MIILIMIIIIVIRIIVILIVTIIKIKVMLTTMKIKIIRNIIKYICSVHVNDDSYIILITIMMILITITITTNKILITSKTLREEEKKTRKTITLISYIPTLKRLPCLIFSLNITFIKTKRGICL